MDSISPLRILAVHASYRQRGGEDISFETEVELLSRAGHDVRTFVRANSDLEALNGVRQAARTIRNREAGDAIRQLIQDSPPDVVYINNLYPALSSSVLSVSLDAGIPVLMAVRNYRMTCIRGTHFRDGQSCYSCVGSLRGIPGIIHGCWGSSPLAAAVMTVARDRVARRTIDHPLVQFAAVSEFVAAQVRSWGVPPHRVKVKPNTLLDVPEVGPGKAGRALFVGRPEPEKGLTEAVLAFQDVARENDELVVVGAPKRIAESGTANIQWLDARGQNQVLDLMRNVALTVIPSLWDEPFGRVAIESLACGTPVLVSPRGGLQAIPEQDVSGLVADPADRDIFAAGMDRMLHDDYWLSDARHAARLRFESQFHPENVIDGLITLLRAAAESRGIGRCI